MIYLPASEDPVDMKLAEYINNYPDKAKMKIMFMQGLKNILKGSLSN
jgi:hypothetical protein